MNDLSRFSRKSLKTGTLWAEVQARALAAGEKGLLNLQAPSCTMLEQNGIRFPVCISNGMTSEHDVDPLSAEPQDWIDPALYIADISASHVCLLCPQSINMHHLILKRMKSGGRDKVLDRDDLNAVALCLNEMDCLVYFDSLTDGRAGRKQMQLMPLPLTPDLPTLPLEPIVRDAVYHGPVGASPELPFAHGIVRMPELKQGKSRLDVLEQVYELILCYLGLRDMVGSLIGNYDVLINRRWMMVAPRSRECYESISLDALAYAGMICVKDQCQVDLMQHTGPLSVLRYLGRS